MPRGYAAAMRRVVLLPLLSLLAASAVASAAALRAIPVPLDPSDPAHARVGALRYLGGWVLASGDRRFGGISSMTVRGDFVTALSDEGMTIGFRLGPRGPVRDFRIAPLPDGPGTTADKAHRDSESLQQDAVSGRIWVGFERVNEIWRYAAGMARAEAHAAPPAMRDWPENGGAEAIARLADGRFIVFSEEQPGPNGSTEALLFPGDPTDPAVEPVRFGYYAPAGYRVTDAAQLPDGRVLLLNRRFTIAEGVSAIVTVADPRAIVADAAWRPREIARLAPPLTVDNMEALAITREHGRTIVWIASDDNFNPLQRTLLLKFSLEEQR